MYLKALRLHGFKSFADPTTLTYEPGVTAIVGPNGCGKSNIADAIRWVLGEQSAKALRGAKMQDVIFEGAETRKPAQICEVSLHLADCETQLGSEFHEIEIMRRGHRDGLGEYFFNGQPCRLKDIQRLFMDTGVGRTSYSILAQGHIDQVLSSKPEERRAVFEEAAGITKYKSQRHEAMNKLALTEQNLARVTDIVGEIARQIGSLRRQASKAVRYKRVSHRLRHLSLALGNWNYRQVTASAAALESEVATLRAAAGQRRSALESRQGALDAGKARRSQLNQRIQESQQAVYDLRSQKDQAESAANLSLTRSAGLSERLAAARGDFGEIEMQIREVASRADSGTQDKEKQLSLLGSSDAVFQQRNRELAVAEGRLARLEPQLQQAKFDLLQFESTVARLRTESSGYEVDLKTSGHRHDALAAEIDDLRKQEAAAAEAAAALDARVEDALAIKSRAHNETASAQQALSDLNKEHREAQRGLQDIDRRLAQRGAHLKLLQQLLEKWEGFGEGAKALLQGRLADALGGSKAVPILSGIEVAPEWGKALEALLGTAAEAIAVADVGAAGRILHQLEQEQIGPAILQITEISGTGLRPAHSIALPPGLIPATDALRNPESSHPAVALLSACYIADDLGAFLDFWRANPGFTFLSVATRKGEVVDRRGLVSGGHLASRKAAVGIVQRDIDLRETARHLAEDQKTHEKQRLGIERLNAAMAAAEQDLEQRRAGVLAATQNAAAVQAEQHNARQAVQDFENRVRARQGELKALEKARDEAQVRWVRAKEGLVAAESAAARQREAIQTLEVSLVEARSDRDMKREAVATARLELAERRQKVEVLDRGLGEMDRRRQELGELLAQRETEIETWTEQAGALQKEAAAEKDRASRLMETIGVAQDQVEKIRGELSGLEKEIEGLELAQTSLREQADAAHDELGAQEVRLAEARQRAQFIVEEVSREYQADVSTLDWKMLLWRSEDEPEGMKTLDLDDEEEAPRGRKAKARGEPAPADLAALDSTNWDEIRASADSLRQRLAAMGAVNLVAIEEYSELKQRHDFLHGQSSDLGNARADLLKAIDDINKTSQRQFATAFEQIRKNFSYTFETLFGGGRASLELVETEDVLESGIEIVAQPPGTRLKSISLLSGGQRALTAVALLFALYMVKPSPFCLLDELDAPLDETNIGRFTDLLKKFVPGSQFIIITHNKRTVAAAGAIYGVTMEERGVSKTVSMRFNRERDEAEAHPITIADSVTTALPATAPA